MDIGKPLIEAIHENNLANCPRIASLIHEMNRGSNYSYATLFKVVNFCKVLGGDGFIHSKEMSHLGLTVSPLVSLASLFYAFQRLEVNVRKRSGWEEICIMRGAEASQSHI